MFYRARYYQPSIGRFLSEDPNPDSSGRESDISQYVFVLSDPVNLLDPTGLSWVTFDRGSSTVTVYDGSGNVRFSCSACNTTTNPAGDPNTPESNGPIPPGVFPVGAPRSNASGARYRTYFNGEGICFFPIEHPRRPGLGIHSHGGGRVKDQATGRIVPRQDSSPTQGCIRVPQECLGKMTQVPQSDPIIGLTVK